MKNLKIQILIIIGLVIGLSSCKKDDPKSDLDKRKEAVSTSWEVQSATPGTENVDFESPVTINFSLDGNYNIENFESLDAANLNHDGVLSSSGTWEISENNLDLVTLEDGNSVTITQLNETNFNFNYSSAYPKATDDAQTISISTTKVN